MRIQTVFIAGAGLMGGGIAQVSAQAGYTVHLIDLSEAALEKARSAISGSLIKLAEKGKITDTPEAVLSRIVTATEYGGCESADLCIEAVFENADLKYDIFSKLDAAAPAGAILASNTSSIPISNLAARTRRPGQVIGLHFFSPVPLMPATEVIRGMLTTDETFQTGLDFVKTLQKEPIPVHKDVPGFVINRINFRANMEAMRLVEEGVATVEEIDSGLRRAAGRKMGIFETGDMVGLDVTCGALTAIYEETKDPSWYPPAILRRKVAAGHLGRKTGRGWYEYDEEGNRK